MIDRTAKINRIYAEWLSFPRDIRVLIESLKSHIHPAKHSLEASAIRKFYSAHYNNPDPTVRDGADLVYISQSLPHLKEVNITKANIIDLCCGGFSLNNLLKENSLKPASYTGVDYSWYGKIPPDVTFYRQGIETFSNSNTCETLFFCSNGFCFLHDLNEVECIRDAPTNSTLILIEPFPSLYWDQNYNDIVPKYRKPEELSSQLSVQGWKLISLTVSQVFPSFGKFGIPLSYSMSLVKT